VVDEAPAARFVDKLVRALESARELDEKKPAPPGEPESKMT